MLEAAGMNGNLDSMINNILEKIAQGYVFARKEWLRDRKNLFKDGKLLGYYEAKETILSALNAEESINSAAEALASLYTRAKSEWLADRRNPFKDGKFLACYEVLNMLPAAN